MHPIAEDMEKQIWGEKLWQAEYFFFVDLKGCIDSFSDMHQIAENTKRQNIETSHGNYFLDLKVVRKFGKALEIQQIARDTKM